MFFLDMELKKPNESDRPKQVIVILLFWAKPFCCTIKDSMGGGSPDINAILEQKVNFFNLCPIISLGPDFLSPPTHGIIFFLKTGSPYLKQ